jgi:hypothetical protein
VPEKIPTAEKSKKACTLKLASWLTLGKYDESDDAWDFVDDDIETDEVNISQVTKPEQEPYVEPSTESIQKVRRISLQRF